MPCEGVGGMQVGGAGVVSLIRYKGEAAETHTLNVSYKKTKVS